MFGLDPGLVLGVLDHGLVVFAVPSSEHLEFGEAIVNRVEVELFLRESLFDKVLFLVDFGGLVHSLQEGKVLLLSVVHELVPNHFGVLLS